MLCQRLFKRDNASTSFSLGTFVIQWALLLLLYEMEKSLGIKDKQYHRVEPGHQVVKDIKD